MIKIDISEQSKDKLREIINTVYSEDNPYLPIPTIDDKGLGRSLAFQVGSIKKIKTYSAKNSETIRFRIIKILSILKHANKTNNKYYSKWKEKSENVLNSLKEILVKYNIRQYELFLKNSDRNLTIEEVLEENRKNNYRELLEGDIISVYLHKIIPDEIKSKIVSILPEHPWEAYPLARSIHRHFIIHVGGTNTGKTYQSLERLKSVKSGAYLGPLRLLAMEVQENLKNSGVLCSLLTGEEEEIIKGAEHISSTVEMANYQKYYDVVVIDECQMIDDRQRGGNWTEAIMGIRSPEIHLCMAPEALEICKEIIKNCEDTFEVISHERFVPLKYENIPYEFDFKKHLKEGDALIVFSRKKVLALAQELESIGIHASVVYGALPYDSRKAQINRFINKETQVVVSTDAIGMGLNLPIHRVIFMETEKYDGESVRPLHVEEIKQIAGRAGRRGMYSEGFVGALEDKKYVSLALKNSVPPIEFLYINFPESLINIDAKLEDIIQVWHNINSNDDLYWKQSVERILKLLEYIKKYKNLDKRSKYSLCTIPFDETSEEFLNQWLGYCQEYNDGKLLIEKPKCIKGDLEGYENYYKALGLYFAFSKKMNLEYDYIWLKEELKKTSEAINKLLISSFGKSVKKCKVCGRKLPWNSKFGICEKCYRKKQMEFDNWDDYI